MYTVRFKNICHVNLRITKTFEDLKSDEILNEVLSNNVISSNE